MPDDLNLKQYEAVKIFDKPLIINAGPGTGKTKTLISKVGYALENKFFEASEIAILTFTEKAGKELVSRLGANKVGFVGTFHALCYKLISQNRDVRLIPSNTRREIIESLDSKLKVREVELAISLFKNKVSTENADLVEAYNTKLQKLGFIDFDDLLLRTVEILRSTQNDEKNFKYILVDEFQDTNSLQYEILKLLGQGGTICIIGDPLQSIYGFRGVTSEIFDNFKKDFPKFIEITLDTNYRSTKEIIETSHRLFPESSQLNANYHAKGEVKLLKTSDEFSEANFVIREISKFVGGRDLNEASEMVYADMKACFADFAIIYRTHNLARVLKQKFRESGIPFQVVGEGSFYETKGFLDFFAALEKLYQNGFNTKESFSKAASKLAPRKRSTDFNEMLNDLVRFDKFDPSTGSGQAFLEYQKYIRELGENQGYDKKADKVSLLSIHASKGLEFEYVFICGFEEGSIPFIKNPQQVDLQEEKRLLYVAMTRAKRFLTLISAKKRNRVFTRPSSFEPLLHASPSLIIQEDEIAKKVETRREKFNQKKSQLKMF